MVPVFDLSNHDTLQGTHQAFHRLERQGDSVPSSSAASKGYLDMFGRRTPRGNSSRDAPPTDEFFISYGEKSNRSLMEQYGFTTPGNPHDRLGDWLIPGLLPCDRAADELVSRDRVMAALSRLLLANRAGGGRLQLEQEGQGDRRLQAVACGLIKSAGCG